MSPGALYNHEHQLLKENEVCVYYAPIQSKESVHPLIQSAFKMSTYCVLAAVLGTVSTRATVLDLLQHMVYSERQI